MLRRLPILLLFAFAAPAHAGTVKLTVTTAAGACAAGCTRTLTVADTDLATLATVFQARCTAALPPNADGSAPTPCTVAQGVQGYFVTLAAELQTIIYNWNSNQAAGAVAVPSVQ